MLERQHTKSAANIYYSNTPTHTVNRSHSRSIAIKQRTYVQLLALSTNLTDSFDKIIQRLLDAYNGHKKEIKSLQSDSDLGRDLNQIASAATPSRGDNP